MPYCGQTLENTYATIFRNFLKNKSDINKDLEV